MRHKGLIFATSVGAGIVVFLFLYYIEGLKVGIIGGTIGMLASFIYMFFSFQRSAGAEERLKNRCANETIHYSDTASIMNDEREIVGAFAITNKRFTFESIKQAQNFVIDIKIEQIKSVERVKGFLVIMDKNSRTYRFKVFHCERIIEILNEELQNIQ